MLPVEQPVKPYTGLDGKPLDGGYVYFGQPNLNPITAPITVYWDAAGTQPAAQPLRTANGYIVRNGTPSNVFFDGNPYSEVVQDSAKRQVFYARTSDDFSIAGLVLSVVNFIQIGIGAVIRSLTDKVRETITPEDFGAAGDGFTNDTIALNKWATALQTSKANGKCLSKIYRVSQANSGIVFQNLTSKRIDFNKAVFKTIDGDTVANNQAGLYFKNCTDCDFVSFIYDGNRGTRVPAEVFSHNVTISESMIRCRFWSCRSINAVCDAWYIAPITESDQTKYPTDIHLHDCDGFNSYRNNLSLIGSLRFRMYGGSLNGATGTAPQCGFDVEPDSSTTYANDQFEFHNVTTNDNAGFGRQYGGPIENTSGKDVGARGRNNAAGFMNLSRCKGLEVLNPKCGPHPTATRGLIDLASTSLDVKIVNPSFNDITPTTAAGCIYVHGSALGSVVQGVYAKNVACSVIVDFGLVSVRNVYIDGCTANAPALNMGGTSAEMTDIIVKNATNRAIYVAGPNTSLINAIVEDCQIAGGNGAIEFDTTATGSIVRGAKISQSSGIVPSGQSAVRALCPMTELTNVRAFGGYTTANVLNSTKTNLLTTKITNMSPDPFSLTFSYPGSTIPSGWSFVATQTGAFPLADIGTPITITADTDFKGVQIYAELFNNIGSVGYYFLNNTTGPQTVAACNITMRARKI